MQTRHADRGWNLPQSGCLDVVLEQANLTDCFADYVVTPSAGSPASTSISSLPGEEKFTAHVNEPLYRIDYCLVSPSMLNIFTVSKAQVLRHITLSDHYPLCVDFALKNASDKEESDRRRSKLCYLSIMGTGRGTSLESDSYAYESSGVDV